MAPGQIHPMITLGLSSEQ